MTESRATTAPGGQARPQPDSDGHITAPSDPGPNDRTATFAALHVPAFRALWLSGVFSFMSIQMQFLLRGLLAWDLTESEGALGIVFLFFGLSLAVSTLFGGVAADRLSKRRLMLVGQFLLVLTALGMGTALTTGVIQFWMLLVSSALQGLMFGLIGPARISDDNRACGPGTPGQRHHALVAVAEREPRDCPFAGGNTRGYSRCLALQARTSSRPPSRR